MSNAVAQRSMMALFNPQIWAVLRDQASILYKCGFFGNTIKSPEAAIAIIMKGYELSIPPMQACAHIFSINGKLGCTAELMLALIFRDCRGATVDFLTIDNNSCVILASRPNHMPIKFTFSMEDAKKAQLENGNTWKKYPRALLRSRCISEMARTLFADAINGMSYTPEELDPTIPFDPTNEAPITLAPAEKPRVELPPARLFDPKNKGASAILEKLTERFPNRAFDSHYKGRLANEILVGREIKPGFLEQGVKDLDEIIAESDEAMQSGAPDEIEMTL